MQQNNNNVAVFILNLEEKLGLLDKNQEISIIWQRIREKIEGEIIRSIQLSKNSYVIDNIKTKLKINPCNKAYALIYNSIIKNPLISFKRPKYLFFSNPCGIVDKVNTYHDIYTEYFVAELPKNEVISIEDPWEYTHIKAIRNGSIKYGDFLVLCIYFMAFIRARKMKKTTLIILDDIEKKIFNEFQFKIKIKDLARNTLFKRNGVIPVYRFLFKWLKPKYIFYIAKYTDMGVVEAAHIENIPIIELQHGVFGFSLNYNKDQDINSIPDYIFCFGKYWVDNNYIPINKCKLFSVGYPFLDTANSYLNSIRKNQIVFISQGDQLVKNAVMLAEFLDLEYRIIYKLRPDEYNIWRKRYPELLLAKDSNKLEVIDNDSYSIYKILCESKYQVGISSTLLLEGARLGCKTILIRQEENNYMQSLVDNNLAIFTKQVSFDDLKDAPDISDKIDYFFEKGWKKNFLNALKSIEKNYLKVDL